MTPEELDAIEARANAATDGPWRGVVDVTSPVDAPFFVVAEIGWGRVVADRESLDDSDESVTADTAFIAHARTDVPALVNEVRRLREHSITLNAIGWAMAVALGDVAETADRHEGDPREQCDRLVAALRAEREEVRRLVTLVNDQRWELDRRDRAIARAEAAEAEVARLRVLTDVQRSVNETMTRLRHESVAERDAAIARAEAAEVAIAAVRALHVDSWQKGVCDVCETDYHMPCATIRALDAGATT